jgi:hypothetical protein
MALPLAYLVPNPELHAHACGNDVAAWLNVIIASTAFVQVNPTGVPVGLKRLDGSAYLVPYPAADHGHAYMYGDVVNDAEIIELSRTNEISCTATEVIADGLL